MFDTIIHDNIEQPASCPTINEGFFQDHLSGVAFRRRRKACKKNNRPVGVPGQAPLNAGIFNRHIVDIPRIIF